MVTPLEKAHHCVYALHYHLVLVTKYRRPALTAPMLERIGSLATLRLADRGGRLIEAGGEPDHVHFLFTLPPTEAPAAFVNVLKTNTSRLLRKEFADELGRYYRKPVLWSRSYCVISAGGAPLEILKRYVAHQAGADGPS